MSETTKALRAALKNVNYAVREWLCESFIAVGVRVMPKHYLPVMATEALAQGIQVGRQQAEKEAFFNKLQEFNDAVTSGSAIVRGFNPGGSIVSTTQEELDAIQAAISGDFANPDDYPSATLDELETLMREGVQGPPEEGWPQRSDLSPDMKHVLFNEPKPDTRNIGKLSIPRHMPEPQIGDEIEVSGWKMKVMGVEREMGATFAVGEVLNADERAGELVSTQARPSWLDRDAKVKP